MRIGIIGGGAAGLFCALIAKLRIIYFYFKDYEINSYDELHNLLSKENLINCLKNISKNKY